MFGSRKRVLGLVTIGQSPRDDIMPQMLPLLPAGSDIRQMDALDGLTHEQIAELAPGPQDYFLHTRLRDDSAVTVGRERIESFLQACLKQLKSQGANPIALLCTEEFPELQSDALLIEPDRLLISVVGGLRPRRPGVLVPLPSQISRGREIQDAGSRGSVRDRIALWGTDQAHPGGGGVGRALSGLGGHGLHGLYIGPQTGGHAGDRQAGHPGFQGGGTDSGGIGGVEMRGCYPRHSRPEPPSRLSRC